MTTAAPWLALLSLLAPAATAQQQDFSKVQIATRTVGGVVSELEGSGGNIGVSVGPDGVLIVDDQFAPLAEKIHAAQAHVAGAGAGKPRFVINTHWHRDHVGGNAAFGKDGTLIAQAAVRKRMAAGQDLLGTPVPPAPPEALPVITYADALSVHFNGEEIRVRHLPPGHTDGDSLVWFTGSNVVHLGDQFFNGMFPFVDLSSGGSVTGLEASIAALLAELPADCKLIPGHGPLSDMAGLAEYHRMLVASIDAVRKGLASGASLADIQAKGLPAEWSSWSSSFVPTAKWLETIAASLAHDAAAPGSDAGTSGAGQPQGAHTTAPNDGAPPTAPHGAAPDPAEPSGTAAPR